MVGLGSGQESLLAGLLAFILPIPGLDGAVLEGSSEREAEEPGSPDVGHLVHEVEVQRSLFLGLAS